MDDIVLKGIQIQGSVRVVTRYTDELHAAFVENKTAKHGGMNTTDMRVMYKHWMREGEYKGPVGRPSREDMRNSVAFVPYVYVPPRM